MKFKWSWRKTPPKPTATFSSSKTASKIARRGHPETPEDGTRVPMIAGVSVRDIGDDDIEIFHLGNIGPGSGH